MYCKMNFKGDESRTDADIMFLMEGAKTTASVRSYSWMMSTHFAANFLDGLEVRPDYIHIGAVSGDAFRGNDVGISPFKTRYECSVLHHALLFF